MTDAVAGSSVLIERASPAATAAAVDELAELLADAVEHGASVNFVAPLSRDAAAAWWRARLPQVEEHVITPVLARDVASRRLLGVVLLVRAQQQNGPHRAEIQKLLVHSSARRRGVATALMREAEAVARGAGRWLLILDTETGGDADRLYRRLGWREVGTIDDYALNTAGTPIAATFFAKDLR